MPAKLLVVDDDEVLRRLMRIELSDAYDIVDSGEPEEGLAVALEHRPDAILLDLRMPKYSGYQLCETFTTFSRTQMIPVIIVSGEAGGLTKARCMQLGAAGYFEKPIDFEALRACLVSEIAKAKSRRRVPQVENPVRLHVPLKLRGTNRQGKGFEELVTTENVTVRGFLCGCTAEPASDSIVDVYLTTYGEVRVGNARMVQSNSKRGPVPQYACTFIGKMGPWVLQ